MPRVDNPGPANPRPSSPSSGSGQPVANNERERLQTFINSIVKFENNRYVVQGSIDHIVLAIDLLEGDNSLWRGSSGGDAQGAIKALKQKFIDELAKNKNPRVKRFRLNYGVTSNSPSGSVFEAGLEFHPAGVENPNSIGIGATERSFGLRGTIGTGMTRASANLPVLGKKDPYFNIFYGDLTAGFGSIYGLQAGIGPLNYSITNRAFVFEPLSYVAMSAFNAFENHSAYTGNKKAIESEIVNAYSKNNFLELGVSAFKYSLLDPVTLNDEIYGLAGYRFRNVTKGQIKGSDGKIIDKGVTYKLRNEARAWHEMWNNLQVLELLNDSSRMGKVTSVFLRIGHDFEDTARNTKDGFLELKLTGEGLNKEAQILKAKLFVLGNVLPGLFNKGILGGFKGYAKQAELDKAIASLNQTLKDLTGIEGLLKLEAGKVVTDKEKLTELFKSSESDGLKASILSLFCFIDKDSQTQIGKLEYEKDLSLIKSDDGSSISKEQILSQISSSSLLNSLKNTQNNLIEKLQSARAGLRKKNYHAVSEFLNGIGFTKSNCGFSTLLLLLSSTVSELEALASQNKTAKREYSELIKFFRQSRDLLHEIVEQGLESQIKSNLSENQNQSALDLTKLAYYVNLGMRSIIYDRKPVSSSTTAAAVTSTPTRTASSNPSNPQKNQPPQNHPPTISA